MLLGIRSLQDIDGKIVGQDFMEVVCRTRSQLDQHPFVVMTRRWISQQRSAPIKRVPDIRKESYATTQGNFKIRLKPWVDRSWCETAVEFNPQPVWCTPTDHTGENIRGTSSSQPMPQDFSPISFVPLEGVFSSGSVPILPEVNISEVQLKLKMQVDNIGENSSTPRITTTRDLKVDPHITDLLMRTIELAVTNEQLDKCKIAITELVGFCHTLSQLPTVIPRDIVQGFVQQILGHEGLKGVTWGNDFEAQAESVQGLAYPEPMLSTPGPIRRTPRSTTPHFAGRHHIPTVVTCDEKRILSCGK